MLEVRVIYQPAGGCIEETSFLMITRVRVNNLFSLRCSIMMTFHSFIITIQDFLPPAAAHSGMVWVRAGPAAARPPAPPPNPGGRAAGVRTQTQRTPEQL